MRPSGFAEGFTPTSSATPESCPCIEAQEASMGYLRNCCPAWSRSASVLHGSHPLLDDLFELGGQFGDGFAAELHGAVGGFSNEDVEFGEGGVFVGIIVAELGA